MTVITERDAKIAELCSKGRDAWTVEDWKFVETLKEKMKRG